MVREEGSFIIKSLVPNSRIEMYGPESIESQSGTDAVLEVKNHSS